MSMQAAMQSLLEQESVFLTLFSVLLGLGVVLYFHRNRNLPPGPYSLPWIGYLPFIGNTPHIQLAGLAKRYGDVMCFTVMGKNYVHLNSLEVIKEAFLDKAEDFSGRHPAFSLLNWMDDGKGIAQTEGQVWREQRQFFLQSIKKFGYGKTSLEAHIHDASTELSKILKNSGGNPFDIDVALSNCTCNVIGKMILYKEYEYGDKDFAQLASMMSRVSQQFAGNRVFYIGPVAKLLFPFLPGGKILEEAKIGIHSIVGKLINHHKKTFDKNHIRDFTDCYLEELDKLKEKKISENSSFSMDTLHSINVNLLTEGTDAVAATIYGMLRILMQHPEIQKAVQKEIDDVIGTERFPSWSDRINLPFTEATLYELQRFSIPFPLAGFHSNPRESTLRGYRIPKRSVIIPNLWSVHMDPKLFPDPEKFDPKRFLNSQGKCEKKDGFVNFGLGKRTCVGEPLAIMEVFLFLTCLLQKFTFEDAKNNDPEQTHYKLIAIPRVH